LVDGYHLLVYLCSRHALQKKFEMLIFFLLINGSLLQYLMVDYNGQ
jgi:hypothetical protein